MSKLIFNAGPSGLTALLLIVAIQDAGRAAAQPLGPDSGPLSEVSRPLSDTSRSIHERGRTVREGSVGSMKSGPVRGGRRVGMLSGPVSDISVGPVSEGRSMAGGGSVAEHSSGAVKQEMDRSLGEQVYDLQRALGPLQERLREQAALDAAAAADAAAHAAEVDPEDATGEPELQPESDGEPVEGAPAVAGSDDTELPDTQPSDDDVGEPSEPADDTTID